MVVLVRNQTIGLSEVGTMYKTCALLRNVMTCLNGSSTSTFMEINPRLEEYFTTYSFATFSHY